MTIHIVVLVAIWLMLITLGYVMILDNVNKERGLDRYMHIVICTILHTTITVLLPVGVSVLS